MKINIKRYFLPLAAVLFMAGCHEAVEPEAIDVNYSSFEDADPELYARYMQALREYKAGSHKAVFVTMSVPENGAPTTHRTQHFTAMPDSVDFIVVNPVPSVLCQTLVDEIRKVHEKGTRILFNIDLQTFENDWTQVLKEDPTLSEEDALAYLGGRVGEQIALVDRWGYDGFIFTYTGKAVGSMQDEALAVYTAVRKRSSLRSALGMRPTRRMRSSSAVSPEPLRRRICRCWTSAPTSSCRPMT